MGGHGDLRNFLLVLPVLVLSMSLHELAHAYVANALGDPTARLLGRLTFNPIPHIDPIGTAVFAVTYFGTGFMFGWAKPVPVVPHNFKNPQRDMALVAIAGPI